MIEIKTKRKGISFFISDEDADLLVDKKWGKHQSYICCRKTNERLHRVILERKLGRPLEVGEIPDHKDLDKMNNTRDNIRLANHTQNVINRPLQSNNTSGYFGIYYNDKRDIWRACVYLGEKRYEAGHYRDKIDAAIAYNHKALELHVDFAKFNDIPGWRDIYPKPIERPKRYRNTKGYTFHKDMQKYMAYIRYEGKTLHLGYHATEAAARAAHEAKYRELYGADAFFGEVA